MNPRFISLVKKFAPALVAFAVLVLPTVLFAATETFTTGLVHCEGSLTPEEISAGNVKQCDFNTLIEGIQYLINWMFAIAIPIAIGIFAYAGVLFMSATEGNIKKAKEMLPKVVWGIAIMSGAWIIVHTILSLLTESDQGYTSLLK